MEPALNFEDIEIRGLTSDSRKVGEGFLFAALPGRQADGRNFIAQAVAKGAVAVLAPTGTEVSEAAVRLVTDAEPRRRLALMAACFHGPQPAVIAAVTGTNGKTSVASFTRQIWEGLGETAASLGTLGLTPARPYGPDSLTTPDPVDLQRCLAALAREGVDHLVLEASSHGLDQFRLDGVKVTAAAFTNLTRDHLDYHQTMPAYLAAKARLFGELLATDGTAVLNADAPECDALRGLCDGRGIEVLTYGRGECDLSLVKQTPEADGQSLVLRVFGKLHRVALPLAGDFQAANVLAALGLVLAGGADADAAIAVLETLQGVPGRVELVAHTAAGGSVYVDYAHTPGALQSVLEALRPHTRNRLTVVVGCGGDRDRGKRPMMGAIAQGLADQAIITDDNPRSEDPAAIRAEVMAAAPKAEEIGDRRRAIFHAVAAQGPGDVLVIAGKGHETGQTVGDEVLPFDDREVAREAAANDRKGAGS
jgi:UDP-N-acetylmuramoyl-L-alanyl-D-glutamate--2,6-diaminopimelate ligase